MATTGTTSFNPNFLDIAEEAWERASGGATELRSGYHLRTARRSLNLLLLDWANRGLNLWTLEQGTLAMTAGTTRYALPADTVDLLECRVHDVDQSQANDIPMQRISVADYSYRQGLSTQGRPTTVTVDRQVDAPYVMVWPIPNDDSYELRYWRIRRMQDAGNGVNSQDVPFRFTPALVAGLAYMLATKLPEGAARLQMLKGQYDEAWTLASNEDREKAPLRIVPMSYRV
jgi:hypothetical protein